MVFPHTFRTEHTETKTTSSTYGEFYEKRKIVHVSLEPDVIELLKYVDDCRDKYINDLKEVIEVPSISGVFKYRNDVKRMIGIIEDWFKKLKVKYECYDAGWEQIDGLCVKLPVVLLGSLGKGAGKKTLCIYSHLDVTSPEAETWDSDPFELTERNKTLYGKGVAYGKGPLICWFHAIQAYQKHKMNLPVNFKFIIESMNLHASEGLENLLKTVKPKFLANINCVVLCGSEWLGNKYPCLVYGCAGTCRFEITVEQNGNSDPKHDLSKIFSTLVNANNKILIPNFYDHVEQITPAEERLYDAIDFNFEEIRPTLPENKKHWDKVQMLMSFWRLPDIVVGDDELCNCDKKDTTTYKRQFSLKIVPKQTPDIVAEMVTTYVYDMCKTMNCQSKVVCEMVHAARPWLVDFKNPTYEAARRATIQIYKEDPNMIREDHEIPILLMLLRVIEKDLILLPIANCSSNACNGNENITVKNFFEGTKLMIAFMKQLSYTR